MKRIIFLIFIIFVAQKTHPCPINNSDKHLSFVKDSLGIDSLKNAIYDLRKALELTQNEVLRIDSINNIQNQIIAQDKLAISEINNSYKRQNVKSLHGAIILLLGLFLEIIGAVLLSSESLSKATFKMRPFKTTEYSIGDLGGNQNLDIKINSLQVIGTNLLVLGFVLQFTGTVFVISANMIINTVLICATLGAVFSLSFVLINKIGGLKVTEKLQLTILNIKGIIMFAFEKRLHKKNILICECCFKKIKANSAYIGYLSNTQEYDIPRKFFIGHCTCLEREFEINEKHPNDAFSVKSGKLNTFYINDFNKVKDINERENRKHPSWPCEINDTVNRLKIIEERIHFD